MIPFTYQALLDETFGFRFNCIVDIPELNNKDKQINKDKDKIFNSYKDFHLAHFMKKIQEHIKELQQIDLKN